MKTAGHPINRYKTRKTNEIWLLGGKCKSGTLDSVDLLREVVWTGLFTDSLKVKRTRRLVRDGRVMRFGSGGIIPTEI
jgi:hypothetical protein